MWPVVGAVRRDSHSLSTEMKECWLLPGLNLDGFISGGALLLEKPCFLPTLDRTLTPFSPEGRLGFLGWRVWEEQAGVKH